jgi:hypothetical protein
VTRSRSCARVGGQGREIGRELGVSYESSLRLGVKQSKIDIGEEPGLTTDERAEPRQRMRNLCSNSPLAVANDHGIGALAIASRMASCPAELRFAAWVRIHEWSRIQLRIRARVLAAKGATCTSSQPCSDPR